MEILINYENLQVSLKPYVKPTISILPLEGYVTLLDISGGMHGFEKSTMPNDNQPGNDEDGCPDD